MSVVRSLLESIGKRSFTPVRRRASEAAPRGHARLAAFVLLVAVVSIASLWGAGAPLWPSQAVTLAALAALGGGAMWLLGQDARASQPAAGPEDASDGPDSTALLREVDGLRGALDVERRVAEELRQVDAMRTTFIQAVSHELRTPLTAITGYTQTLNRGAGRLDDATRAHLLERLEVNAARLDRMLGDLLDVDRLSSHAIEPVRRWFDVSDLCRRVIDQIEVTTHPVTCTSGEVRAKLDAAKVERIVENLVRNALKHTEPGTPIVVEVERDEVVGGAVVAVVDHGPGIPEDLVGSIFDPFVQGPDSAASANPGTGIGLSLVARFTELHGGRAWVEPRPQGGAVFRAWLPGDPAERHDPDRGPDGGSSQDDLVWLRRTPDPRGPIDQPPVFRPLDTRSDSPVSSGGPVWSFGATQHTSPGSPSGPARTPVLSYPRSGSVPVASLLSRP